MNEAARQDRGRAIREAVDFATELFEDGAIDFADVADCAFDNVQGQYMEDLSTDTELEADVVAEVLRRQEEGRFNR